MSKPYVPHRVQTGDQLDPERINDNLEKMARDLSGSMDRRYTYSTLVFPVDGIVNTDTAAERTFRLRLWPSGLTAEVAFLELVIYSATGATWTLTCSDSVWPSISVATAGATTEARAVSNSRVQVGSVAGTDFVLSASAASTITRGYIVVHLRTDRGNQGDSFTGYTPTLLNAASVTAGATLDTELEAFEDAVARDTAADSDIRIETFRVLDLASGSVVWRVPGGARRLVGAHLVAVGTLTVDLDLDINGTGALGVTATGTSNVVEGVADLTGLLDPGTDPMDSADDSIITLTSTGGTISVGYVSLIWS